MKLKLLDYLVIANPDVAIVTGNRLIQKKQEKCLNMFWLYIWLQKMEGSDKMGL